MFPYILEILLSTLKPADETFHSRTNVKSPRESMTLSYVKFAFYVPRQRTKFLCNSEHFPVLFA